MIGAFRLEDDGGMRRAAVVLGPAVVAELRTKAALIEAEVDGLNRRADRLEDEGTRFAVVVLPFVKRALRHEGRMIWQERECLWSALEGTVDRGELVRIGLALGLAIPFELLPAVRCRQQERRAA